MTPSDRGQSVLHALRGASPTSTHASWLGASPALGANAHVYVVRATSVPSADLAAMVSACESVPGVAGVRYEIDCGDRAVRLEVTFASGTATARSSASALLSAPWRTWVLECVALAAAVIRLANIAF